MVAARPAAGGGACAEAAAPDTTAAGAASGAVTVPITITIDRYTPEHARVTMTDALKHGGYPGFLRALRDAPPAGTLAVAGETFVIRWARQVPNETGRAISIITE